MALEAEAEKGRAELAALLEKAAPGDRRACAVAENACAMETLRLELANQEVSPASWNHGIMQHQVSVLQMDSDVRCQDGTVIEYHFLGVL